MPPFPAFAGDSQRRGCCRRCCGDLGYGLGEATGSGASEHRRAGNSRKHVRYPKHRVLPEVPRPLPTGGSHAQRAHAPKTDFLFWRPELVTYEGRSTCAGVLLREPTLVFHLKSSLVDVGDTQLQRWQVGACAVGWRRGEEEALRGGRRTSSQLVVARRTARVHLRRQGKHGFAAHGRGARSQ